MEPERGGAGGGAAGRRGGRRSGRSGRTRTRGGRAPAPQAGFGTRPSVPPSSGNDAVKPTVDPFAPMPVAAGAASKAPAASFGAPNTGFGSNAPADPFVAPSRPLFGSAAPFGVSAAAEVQADPFAVQPAFGAHAPVGKQAKTARAPSNAFGGDPFAAPSQPGKDARIDPFVPGSSGRNAFGSHVSRPEMKRGAPDPFAQGRSIGGAFGSHANSGKSQSIAVDPFVKGNPGPSAFGVQRKPIGPVGGAMNPFGVPPSSQAPVSAVDPFAPQETANPPSGPFGSGPVVSYPPTYGSKPSEPTFAPPHASTLAKPIGTGKFEVGGGTDRAFLKGRPKQSRAPAVDPFSKPPDQTAKGFRAPSKRSAPWGLASKDGSSTKNQVLVQFLPVGLQKTGALAAHFAQAMPGSSVRVSMSRGRKKTAKVTFASSAEAQSALSMANMYGGEPLKMSIYNPGGSPNREADHRLDVAVETEGGATDGQLNAENDGMSEWRNPAALPLARGAQESGLGSAFGKVASDKLAEKEGKMEVLVQFLPVGLQKTGALVAHFAQAMPGSSVRVSMSRGRKKTAKVTFASSAEAQSALSMANMYGGEPLKMSIYNPGGSPNREADHRLDVAVETEGGATDGQLNAENDGMSEWRNPAALPLARGAQESGVGNAFGKVASDKLAEQEGKMEVLVQFLPVGLQKPGALVAHFAQAMPGSTVRVSMSRGRKKTAKVTFASSAEAQSALSMANMYGGEPLKMSIYNPGGSQNREADHRLDVAVETEGGANDEQLVVDDGVLEWVNPAIQPLDRGTRGSGVGSAHGKVPSEKGAEKEAQMEEMRRKIAEKEAAKKLADAKRKLQGKASARTKPSVREKGRPPAAKPAAQTGHQTIGKGLVFNRPRLSGLDALQPGLADEGNVKEALAFLEERAASAQTAEFAKFQGWQGKSGKVMLHCAEEFIGTCLAMCPVKEQSSRIEISEFEKRPIGDENALLVPDLMVKKYIRSAAAVSRPGSDEVRPPHVLERTMDYLLTNIMSDETYPIEDVYDFINDRCRCIRQDLALQGAQTNDATLAVLEKAVRFHILSEHRLAGKDIEVFDSKMNMEQLHKCLTSTRLVYDARREAGLMSPNEPEFQAYQILCFPTEMNQTCATLSPTLLNSLEVQFALRAMLCITDQKTMYAEYVQMIRDAPILVACLLYRKLTEVRRRALRIMSAVIGNPRRRERASLEDLVDTLGFEDGKQASEFCVWHGLSGDGEAILLDPRDLDTEPESPWKDLPAPRLVESKTGGNELAEVVLGQKQEVYGDISRGRILCDLPTARVGVALRGRTKAIPASLRIATPAYVAEARAERDKAVEKARQGASRRLVDWFENVPAVSLGADGDDIDEPIKPSTPRPPFEAAFAHETPTSGPLTSSAFEESLPVVKPFDWPSRSQRSVSGEKEGPSLSQQPPVSFFGLSPLGPIPGPQPSGQPSEKLLVEEGQTPAKVAPQHIAAPSLPRFEVGPFPVDSGLDAKPIARNLGEQVQSNGDALAAPDANQPQPPGTISPEETGGKLVEDPIAIDLKLLQQCVAEAKALSTGAHGTESLKRTLAIAQELSPRDARNRALEVIGELKGPVLASLVGVLRRASGVDSGGNAALDAMKLEIDSIISMHAHAIQATIEKLETLGKDVILRLCHEEGADALDAFDDDAAVYPEEWQRANPAKKRVLNVNQLAFLSREDWSPPFSGEVSLRCVLPRIQDSMWASCVDKHQVVVLKMTGVGQDARSWTLGMLSGENDSGIVALEIEDAPMKTFLSVIEAERGRFSNDTASVLVVPVDVEPHERLPPVQLRGRLQTALVQSRKNALHRASPPVLVLVVNAEAKPGPGYEAEVRDLLDVGLMEQNGLVAGSRIVHVGLSQRRWDPVGPQTVFEDAMLASVQIVADRSLPRTGFSPVADMAVAHGNSAWLRSMTATENEVNPFRASLIAINSAWRLLGTELSNESRAWAEEYGEERRYFAELGDAVSSALELPEVEKVTKDNANLYALRLASALFGGHRGIVDPTCTSIGHAEFCSAIGQILPTFVSRVLGRVGGCMADLPVAQVGGSAPLPRLRTPRVTVVKPFPVEWGEKAHRRVTLQPTKRPLESARGSSGMKKRRSSLESSGGSFPVGSPAVSMVPASVGFEDRREGVGFHHTSLKRTRSSLVEDDASPSSDVSRALLFSPESGTRKVVRGSHDYVSSQAANVYIHRMDAFLEDAKVYMQKSNEWMERLAREDRVLYSSSHKSL